nr:hypothetical protein [Methanoculleus marisnigri]
MSRNPGRGRPEELSLNKPGVASPAETTVDRRFVEEATAREGHG